MGSWLSTKHDVKGAATFVVDIGDNLLMAIVTIAIAFMFWVYPQVRYPII